MPSADVVLVVVANPEISVKHGCPSRWYTVNDGPDEMDMIGIVYSAISTVEMPTLERCSNLTIYPECVQPHWHARSKKAASTISFVICMLAPLPSRREG